MGRGATPETTMRNVTRRTTVEERPKLSNGRGIPGPEKHLHGAKIIPTKGIGAVRVVADAATNRL